MLVVYFALRDRSYRIFCVRKSFSAVVPFALGDHSYRSYLSRWGILLTGMTAEGQAEEMGGGGMASAGGCAGGGGVASPAFFCAQERVRERDAAAANVEEHLKARRENSVLQK